MAAPQGMIHGVIIKLLHMRNITRKIIYFRSIVPKIGKLVCLCLANKPSIVCLTETWLCSDILDSELHIPNYAIVRRDKNRHRGGVAININSFKVLLSGPSDLELIIIFLQSGRHGNLCVGFFFQTTFVIIYF